LHPPIDDPQGGELPGERWNPTQSVRTVLISIISLLNEVYIIKNMYYHIFTKIYIFISKIIFQPNTYSPANVDASVAFRNWKEGKDNKYKEIIAKQVCLNLSEFLEFFPFFRPNFVGSFKKHLDCR